MTSLRYVLAIAGFVFLAPTVLIPLIGVLAYPVVIFLVLVTLGMWMGSST